MEKNNYWYLVQKTSDSTFLVKMYYNKHLQLQTVKHYTLGHSSSDGHRTENTFMKTVASSPLIYHETSINNIKQPT